MLVFVCMYVWMYACSLDNMLSTDSPLAAAAETSGTVPVIIVHDEEATQIQSTMAPTDVHVPVVAGSTPLVVDAAASLLGLGEDQRTTGTKVPLLAKSAEPPSDAALAVAAATAAATAAAIADAATVVAATPGPDVAAAYSCKSCSNRPPLCFQTDFAFSCHS